MSFDWKFAAWSTLAIVLGILDASYRKRVLRKLDWFIYERPVQKRLLREGAERNARLRAKEVVCIHEGPYR